MHYLRTKTIMTDNGKDTGRFNHKSYISHVNNSLAFNKIMGGKEWN